MRTFASIFASFFARPPFREGLGRVSSLPSSRALPSGRGWGGFLRFNLRAPSLQGGVGEGSTFNHQPSTFNFYRHNQLHPRPRVFTRYGNTAMKYLRPGFQMIQPLAPPCDRVKANAVINHCQEQLTWLEM